MPVRSDSSAAESEKEMSVWFEYLTETMTKTFLAFKTEPQMCDICNTRFYHRLVVYSRVSRP